MTISLAQRVVVPETLTIQDLQGESVLLNLADNCYYGLDEVGTRMWQVLTTSESIAAALPVLEAEYEVAADQLRQDVVELVEKLAAAGLVELAGGEVDLAGGPVDLVGGPVDLAGGPVDLGGGPVDLAGGPVDLGGG